MKLILQVIKALFRKIEASRTHWEEVREVEILAETTVTISDDNSAADLPKTTQLTVGQTYFIILNGVSYECVAWYSDDAEAVIIGNGAIYGGEGGNSEPFSCDSYSGGDIYLNTEKAGTYTISISIKENIIHKLDKKYLPDEVIEGIGIANNAQTAANNAQTTANSKMNASDPVGTGSFSMGRKANSVVGNYSHAEGYDTTASSYGSHAEGLRTTASGKYSHAEGDSTTASGDYSHAEGGNTTASDNYSHAEGHHASASSSYSHAEGYGTTASGYGSHAEGHSTTASGKYSHAECYNTTASGNYSHAEGYYTFAYSVCQHVQGKYNVEDSQNKYAHIVGNGTSLSNSSNAYTLDWKGVPWYQGRPQFGGKAQDQGSQTVMANGDKEIILASSTANSTKKFKIIVDDSGTISATEVTT